MEHRNWNKNNIRTSLLGYGCMRFPTKADGTIDEERAEALLNTRRYPSASGDCEGQAGTLQ